MSKKEAITIRVSSEDKDAIKELARKQGITITEYILKRSLYDITESNKDTSKVKEGKEGKEGTANKGKGVEDISADHKAILNELEVKNKQIESLTRLLDQEQQLRLSAISSKKQLQYELSHVKASTEAKGKEVKDKESKDKESTGLFSWFRRNQ